MKDLNKRIITEKAFVCENVNEQYVMKKHAGTAYKVVSDKTPNYTLTQLLERHQISFNDVDLIKIDTDGFDYEVIIGMADKLSEVSPILHWENAIEEDGTDKSYNGYKRLEKYLLDSGYDDFCIFDNFGNYLFKGNIDFYSNINEYLK